MGIYPDLTFYLDIPASEVKSRTNGVRPEKEARIENEPLEFHMAVRQAYLNIAQANSERIKIIDGTQPSDQILERVLGHILPIIHLD